MWTPRNRHVFRRPLQSTFRDVYVCHHGTRFWVIFISFERGMGDRSSVGPRGVVLSKFAIFLWRFTRFAGHKAIEYAFKILFFCRTIDVLCLSWTSDSIHKVTKCVCVMLRREQSCVLSYRTTIRKIKIVVSAHDVGEQECIVHIITTTRVVRPLL